MEQNEQIVSLNFQKQKNLLNLTHQMLLNLINIVAVIAGTLIASTWLAFITKQATFELAITLTAISLVITGILIMILAKKLIKTRTQIKEL